jgi:hypothetical protein
MFGREPFNLFFFFFQELLLALSSTNYKFPNPRHLGARLKQGLLVLRLAVNCNSMENGWLASQSSSRDYDCRWHLLQRLLLSGLSPRREMAFIGSRMELAKGVTSRRQNSDLQVLGSSIRK